jgi:hypothetical protein
MCPQRAEHGSHCGAAFRVDGCAAGGIGDGRLAIAQHRLVANTNFLGPDNPALPGASPPDDQLAGRAINCGQAVLRRYEAPPSVGKAGNGSIFARPVASGVGRNQKAGSDNRVG